METIEVIARNLVKYRNEKHISQEFLALEGQVSVRTLGKIERAEANPTILILDKICRSLGINLSQLIAESDSEQELDKSG